MKPARYYEERFDQLHEGGPGEPGEKGCPALYLCRNCLSEVQPLPWDPDDCGPTGAVGRCPVCRRALRLADRME